MTETAAILKDAQALAQCFQNSGLYRDYCYHKKALENDPLTFAQVKAFKDSQLKLESKRLREGSVAFDEEKRLSHQYTDLSLHPIAGAFLACEYELLELYRQALDIICEACDVECGST